MCHYRSVMDLMAYHFAMPFRALALRDAAVRCATKDARCLPQVQRAKGAARDTMIKEAKAMPRRRAFYEVRHEALPQRKMCAQLRAMRAR